MVRLSEELYEASVRTFLSEINTIEEDKKCVIFVGHNPTITYLADYLTSAPMSNMDPGSAIVITFQKIAWSEVTQDSGSFVCYRSPKTIA